MPILIFYHHSWQIGPALIMDDITDVKTFVNVFRAMIIAYYLRDIFRDYLKCYRLFR